MRRKPRQTRSQILVDSVVSAAEELLGDAQPLSISRLARRAGVGVASIYDYFADKAGVLDAVVDRLTIRNFELFAHELDEHYELSIDALVDRFIERLIETYLDPSRSELMARLVLLVARRGNLDIHIEYRDKIASRLAGRVRETYTTLTTDEAEACLRGVCDIAMGLVTAELLRRNTDHAALRERLRRAARAEIEHVAGIHAMRAASS